MNTNTQMTEIGNLMIKNDLEEMKQDVRKLRMQFDRQFYPLQEEVPLLNEMDVQRSGNMITDSINAFELNSVY